MVDGPLRLGYVSESYPLLFSCQNSFGLCGSVVELGKVSFCW